MSTFWNALRHKYFGAAATVFLIIMLPVILIANQRPQTITGIAEGATLLTFAPISSEDAPLVKKVGEEFYLDVMLNPGKNLISVVKLDIGYDPLKVKLSPINPIIINNSVFPNVLEGPIYSKGRIQVTLSIGADKTKAISTQISPLTLHFKANSSASTTQIYFGSNTQTLTLSTSTDGDKNVLSTTAPSFIKIN